MVKKRNGSELHKTIEGLVRKYHPFQIQKALARHYGVLLEHAGSGEEGEYWLKVYKSSANLASGMEKWLDEMEEEE